MAWEDTAEQFIGPKGKAQDLKTLHSAVTDFNIKTVSAIGTTPKQLSTTSVTLAKGILLKANNANNKLIGVGKANTVTVNTADATDGFPLSAGQGIFLEVDNLNKVWVVSDSTLNDQRVNFIYI